MRTHRPGALAADPRYDSVKKRAEHAGMLVPQLRAALAERTALEWEALFGSDVPCAAARSIEEMFTHPQVVAENMVATMHHPQVGAYRASPRRCGSAMRRPPSRSARPRSASIRPNCWPPTAMRRKKSPACVHSA